VESSTPNCTTNGAEAVKVPVIAPVAEFRLRPFAAKTEGWLLSENVQGGVEQVAVTVAV